MREYPRGGVIGKAVHTFRFLRSFQVPLHAANACYFMVLAVFPGLLLLLGLLRYTPLEVEYLAELFYGFLPETLAERAEEMILMTWDNTTGTALGISAAAALWSASRGIYGVITGLNAVYGVSENRGYLYTRLLSAVYLFAFLLLLILTLGLHVFSTALAEALGRTAHPALLFLGKIINFRFLVLLGIQTAFFMALFMILPNEKNGLKESLPGALLASGGWQIFTDLYSIYVAHFSPLSSVYGSVYAVALSMLWLYFCMAIVFYGGVLNVLLRKKMISKP